MIDLRTLAPFDEEAILASVRQTNRAVVVTEEADFTSFGRHIHSWITERCFFDLDAALARLVADLLAELGLEGVTLVGNDTGGAICQLVAIRHPERLARLVLTPCDAFENFLPPVFKYLQITARIPGGDRAADAKRCGPAPCGGSRSPTEGSRRGGSRRGARGLGRAADLSTACLAATRSRCLRGHVEPLHARGGGALRELERPTLIAWAPEDRFFKLRDGERLAAAIPDWRLVEIPDAHTFVSEDQPERLADAITRFMAETSQAASGPPSG